MSRWFPAVDNQEGINQALKGGMIGALVFAGTIILGIGVTIYLGRYPGYGGAVTGSFFAGMAIELAIVLIAAWRFKMGKGLISGSIVFLLFAMELVSKFQDGTFRVGWIILYVAIVAGLVNGLRGAWARRTIPPEKNYEGVFE